MTEDTQPTTKPFTYHGGLSAVDIKLPSGRWIRVERGQSVDLLPSEAKAVKALPDWSPTKTKTKTITEDEAPIPAPIDKDTTK